MGLSYLFNEGLQMGLQTSITQLLNKAFPVFNNQDLEEGQKIKTKIIAVAIRNS